ncbi:MAG: YIP1 family protein [Pseudomonadota bacterium]|nr:YIP1 family protein [Pseudomonadota bacterium]
MASEFPEGQPSGAPHGGMIDRIKNILLSPKTEWARIDAEPMTLQSIMIGWVLPLAAIGPIAGVLRNFLFPMTIPFTTISFHPPLIGSIVQAIVTLALTMLGVWVWSLILDALAPSFKGTRNPIAALKLVAFSATAMWLCGIFQLTWATMPLAILGLYSAYIFWVGVPVTMKVLKDQAVVYVIVAVIVGIVVNLVVAAIAATVAGTMFAMTPNVTAFGQSGGSSISIGGTTVDTGKVDAAVAQMTASAATIQANAKAGTSNAVPAADLQAMLPTAIGGFTRGDVESSSGAAAGIGGSRAEGRYTQGDQSFSLSVADMGAMGALATLGGAVNAQTSKTTATGYEKSEMQNGSMVSEKWDNQAHSGSYSTVVASRFAVEAEGGAPSIDVLKGAVGAIDTGKLASLAK